MKKKNQHNHSFLNIHVYIAKKRNCTHDTQNPPSLSKMLITDPLTSKVSLPNSKAIQEEYADNEVKTPSY